MRSPLLLALVLAPAFALEASVDTGALAKAREEIPLSRGDFRRLARVERDAIRDARGTVAATARGRALAPALAAAADALEGVRGQARELSDTLGEMARSYREMAAEFDKEIAPEAKRRAGDLLKAADEEKETPEAKAAWKIVKRGDPRYRALACNMKALGEALAALGEREGEVGAAIATAARLHKALAPMFEGVETERPAPAEAACPT
ncbi:MAG TPA: hypothetical protein VFY93_08450 [Planctomycetota bacterium]|nr:hypothetical protein [Planctomycetota bacterium]